MMGLAPLLYVNINIKGAMMYEMGANEPTCTPLATPLPVLHSYVRLDSPKLGYLTLDWIHKYQESNFLRYIGSYVVFK